MLRTERVSRGFADIDRIKDLYVTAFPANERMPLCFLLSKAKKDFVSFLAFYDEDAFVGFTYLAEHRDMTYVLYLAVNAQTRSKGYGTRILERIGSMYPGNRIILDIEPLDDAADNSEQRIKRRAFYLRNCFASAGFTMIDGSSEYEVLVKGGTCSQAECAAIFKRLSGPVLSPFVKPTFIEQASE